MQPGSPSQEVRGIRGNPTKKTEAARADDILRVLPPPATRLGRAEAMLLPDLCARLDLPKAVLMGKGEPYARALLHLVAVGALTLHSAPIRLSRGELTPVRDANWSALVARREPPAAHLGEDLRARADWFFRDSAAFAELSQGSQAFQLTLQRRALEAGIHGVAFGACIAPCNSNVELRIHPFTRRDEPDVRVLAEVVALSFRPLFGEASLGVRPLSGSQRTPRLAMEVEFSEGARYAAPTPDHRVGGPDVSAQRHPFFAPPHSSRVLVARPEMPSKALRCGALPGDAPLRVIMRPDLIAHELRSLAGGR